MPFRIATDHPCLPGHFPGRPLVPGVVVLEQVLAAIEAGHGPLGRLRLPQVKFVQPLLPGEDARIELDACAGDGATARWRFRVWRGDTLLASGEVVSDECLPDGRAPGDNMQPLAADAAVGGRP